MAVVKIRPRRDTAANWTSVNPTLGEGEIARETDTGRLKYGDGVTAWNALPYWKLPAGDINGAVAIANGGTGATTAAGARGELELGTAATADTSDFVPSAGSKAITGYTSVTNNENSNTVLDIVNSDALGFGLYVRGGGASGRYAAQINNYAGDPLFLVASGGVVRAGADNTQPLGNASFRWSEVFSATGAINTSDKRLKRDIGPLPDEWLDAWSDVQWGRYRFLDGSRWHVGLVAQQVRDVFKRHGLDALEIGLLCYDEWPAARAQKEVRNPTGGVVRPSQPGHKAGNRWGLRYDECQAIEAAWQRRELSRLRDLVTRLPASDR